MALWICLACTAAYSVGAPACPQCTSTAHAEEGTPEAATAGREPADETPSKLAKRGDRVTP